MAAQYFIGTINSNWTQIGNWSATSGGSTNGTIPANGDDVHLDVHSPTCNVNANTAKLNSFNMTGFTQTLTGGGPADDQYSIWVNPASGTVTCLFAGTDNYIGALLMTPATGAVINFTSGGFSFPAGLYSNPYGSSSYGTVSQQDNIVTPAIVEVQGIGTPSCWTTNNHNITASIIWVVTSGILNAGTSTLTATGTGTISGLPFVGDPVLAFFGGTLTGTPTMIMSNTSATSKNFQGGSGSYYILQINGAPGCGTVFIDGGNTFNTLIFEPSSVIALANSTTTTVSYMTSIGTSTGQISLSSDSAGHQATLSCATGTISVTYTSIKDINATGGTTFLAYVQNGCIDISDNSGWNFGYTITPMPCFHPAAGRNF